MSPLLCDCYCGLGSWFIMNYWCLFQKASVLELSEIKRPCGWCLLYFEWKKD